MLTTFYKSSIRNLLKNKTFTGINIFGLSIGISVCMMIFVVVRFETSFDNFHKNKANIYRVISQLHNANIVSTNSSVPTPFPAAFKNDFPDVKKVAPIYSDGNDEIEVLDNSSHVTKKFKEATGMFFTSPDFFDIFDFKWVVGNPSMLNEPDNIILTAGTADKYFGDWKNAVGKLIKRNNQQVYKVAGIIENPPANTDFQLKLVGSFNSLKASKNPDWGSYNSAMGTYVMLPDHLNSHSVDQRLIEFGKKYKKGVDEVKNIQFLQPIADVHFDEQSGNFLGRSISHELIYVLIFIGIFILLIACVNFINLSTAQAVNRAKEVGVRKVLGSSLLQLRTQFLTETSFIVIMAVIFSLIFGMIFLPIVKNILDIPISVNIFHDPLIFVFLILLIPVIIFLSGFYPAVILSKFQPIKALKSKAYSKSNGNISVRKGLVVLQFVIAQSLIIATLVIVQQMDFFTNHSMGFDKTAILNVPIPRDSVSQNKMQFLKDQLNQQGGIQKYTLSFASPADNGNWFSNFKFDSSKETDFGANIKWADHNYVSTYGLKLVAGRNIVESDTASEFLVNEKLLSAIGITDPANALNKIINLWGGKIKGNVVGVLKNFHASSFKDGIPPLLLASNKKFYSMVGIKIASKDLMKTVNDINSIYSKTYPESVFEYQFLDDKIAKFYSDEKKLSQLYKIFAVIAILLSCLGLFGLASFMAVQRIKEVGIRKVLGASVNNIIILFSKEFVLLISVAFIISASLSYYFMSKWLSQYQFRIDLSWQIFLFSGLISLVIALITVSSQAIKAAIVNPVKNLRSE